jgi:hypothetical protein
MTGPKDDDDVLLRALRELPRPAMEPDMEKRTRAAARAAFVRAASPEPLAARLLAPVSRAAVPVALAAVVVLYLSWAFSAAAALVH